MPTVPQSWKQQIARVVRWPLARRLMIWAIYLVVPRQRVGVAVAAVDDDGRVLLLRHVFHPAAPWGLPGGWLSRNENPADGARRELEEETGLTAELGPVIYVKYEPHPPHLEIAYLARLQPGRIHLSMEIIEAAWFAGDNLPAPLLPSTKRIIEAALAADKEYCVNE